MGGGGMAGMMMGRCGQAKRGRRAGGARRVENPGDAADQPVRRCWMAGAARSNGRRWRRLWWGCRETADATARLVFPWRSLPPPRNSRFETRIPRARSCSRNSMSRSRCRFHEETPLEDVLKYIKQATTTEKYAGIPIYVDPGGLKEAEKTMTSTVAQYGSRRYPAQDDASAFAQAVGPGLLRARRRAHHQLATRESSTS